MVTLRRSLILVLLGATCAGGYTFDHTVLTLPSATYGVANEACESPSGSDVTLSAGGAWEAAIESASPGARFFLNAGTYTAGTLVIPNGTSGARITIKNNNCAAVTLAALVQPGSYNTIAGLTITGGINATKGSTYTGLTLRNNLIQSTTFYPVRFLNDGQTDLLVQGNILRTPVGGASGFHTLYLRGARGTNAVITQNKLENLACATCGEDLFQAYNWSGTWTLSRNWFARQPYEDFMDIKYATVGAGTATMQVYENYFDGPLATSPIAGILDHNASDTGVTGGYSMTLDIKGNYFSRCDLAYIHRVSTGPSEVTDLNSRTLLFTYNVVDSLNTTTDGVRIEAHNALIEFNTFLRGSQDFIVNGRDPANTIVRNNIFYQSAFTGFSGIDTCSHNVFFATSGSGTCSNVSTADPLFLNVASNWDLQTGSPARATASDGSNRGAVTAVPALADTTSGLVMHLAFDENTDTTAFDTTVNDHDGTLGTGASWGLPKNGLSALATDGTLAGVVTVPGLLGTPLALTVAGWVQRTVFPTTEGDLVSLGNVVTVRQSATAVSARYQSGPNSFTTATTTASLGTTAWHHVAYTVAPGQQRLYLDGLLAATTSSGAGIVWTGQGTNTIVGGHGTGSATFRFQGRLDDIKVFDRALTEADIAGLYAIADPPPLAVQITSPTTNPSLSVSSATLAGVGGVASGPLTITGVSYNCPTCSPTSDAATGTTSWTLPTLTLTAGTHLLTVTAVDGSSTPATDTLTITYTPVVVGGGAACTHYAASETGTPPGLSGNSGTSQGSPKRIVDMWNILTPGKVLCLLDGTYTGGNNLVQVPTSFAGTASQPITIRALNDGKVTINGGNSRPVDLQGSWGVLEGLNAIGGNNGAIQLRGANWTVRRVVAWIPALDAGVDTQIIGLTGTNSTIEDFAAFGISRGPFRAGSGADGVCTNNVARRGWVRYENRSSGGSPTVVAEMGYGQQCVTFENILATRMRVPGGNLTGPEAPILVHQTQNSFVGGSIAYNVPDALDQGTTFDAGQMFTVYGDLDRIVRNVTLKDIVVFAHPGSNQPSARLSLQGSTGVSHGHSLTNLLNVSSTTPECNTSHWPCAAQVRSGTSLAAALAAYPNPDPTSVWTAVPGVCKRMVNQVTTTTGLWPWPMNQRIQDALVQSGRQGYDVTATMQALFGTIPSQCLSGSIEEETCTPPRVGTPPTCSCPAGTVEPNCEPEVPPVTCPPDCPAQDTFVVATTGSNAEGNTCTLAAPCLTIDRARSFMTPGDTLYLRAGTYSGTGNRITTSTGAFPAGNDWNTSTKIAAYSGETVVLQQTTGTVITLDNPTTDRYLVFDRITCDGASTGANNTVCVNMTNGVHHIRIQNSTLRNTHFRAALLSGVNNIELLNTTIHGATHSAEALLIEGVSDSILLDGVTFHTNNAHGLNATGGGISNLTVKNSVARNNVGTGFLMGASNLLAFNLLAYSNALGVQLTEFAVDGRLYNATMADNSGVEVQVDAGATGNQLTNVLAVGGITDNGTETVQLTNLVTDPGFVSSSDYHLALDTSPAIDEGTCLPGVVDVALDGVARPQPTGGDCDVGSYEQIGDDAPPLPTPGALSARPSASRLFFVP